MRDRVRNVFIDVNRTVWTPDAAHTLALRLALESGDVEVIRFDSERLEPGTRDVLVRVVDADGTASEVPARVPEHYDGRRALAPALIGGHLVTPIVRMPERILALDVDEALMPVSAAWDPIPSEARGALTARGLDIGIDVPCAGVGDKTSYAFELVLDGGDHCLAVPATLESGPGTVGMLRANVPPGRLGVGSEYALLLVSPTRGTTRIGLDLLIDRSGAVSTRPSTKISVIVPAHDAGDYLGECLGSALAQTMPRAEYEVVVVDDGSVDGSGALLDWLTTLHPHLRVIHTRHRPASERIQGDGYVGGPRNVGLSAARGEYVFFLDATDRLATTALADLFRYAQTYEADIVVARTAGRDVAQAAYRQSRPNATIADTPLAESLTPHKLFRKAFLDRHMLRFGSDHGFEDHKFVAAAYLLHPKIAIFADRVCYYRNLSVPRGPHTRSPRGYATSLRDALALVEGLVDDDREHRRFLRRWYRAEVLARLRGPALLQLAEDERIEWFTLLRELAQEHFPLELTTGMSASNRLAAALLDLGRLHSLVGLATWEAGIEGAVRLGSLHWKKRTLRVGLDAELRSGGRPLYVPADNKLLLDPPLNSAGWTALIGRYGTDLVDVSGPAKRKQIDLILRNPRAVKTYRFRIHGKAPAVVPVDELRLAPGRWHMYVRVQVCGWTREVPLTASAAALTRQHAEPPPLCPVRASGGTVWPLAIDIATDRSRPTVVRQKLPSPLRIWSRKVQYAVEDGTDLILHG